MNRNKKILTYFLFEIEESTNEAETDVEDNSTETDDGAVDTDQDNDSKENDTEDSQESDNDAKDTDDQVIMSAFLWIFLKCKNTKTSVFYWRRIKLKNFGISNSLLFRYQKWKYKKTFLIKMM